MLQTGIRPGNILTSKRGKNRITDADEQTPHMAKSHFSVSHSMKSALKKIPGLVALVRLCRIALVPRYRSEWLLERRKPENLFQPVSKTAFDRHPEIFSFIRDRHEYVPFPRILSFGCSTGEEVFSLRRYFPEAEIVGIDINPRSIALCNDKLKRRREKSIRFELAGSADSEPDGHFDAVFCLSVLRHGRLGVDRPQNCESFIRFDDFEKTVSELARVLKPGGYLAIVGSNFRFSDTAVSSAFETVYSYAELLRADTPIYDRENRLLPNLMFGESVFRKRAEPGSMRTARERYNCLERHEPGGSG